MLTLKVFLSSGLAEHDILFQRKSSFGKAKSSALFGGEKQPPSMQPPLPDSEPLMSLSAAASSVIESVSPRLFWVSLPCSHFHKCPFPERMDVPP